MASATVPVKMIEGDHYAGQGSMDSNSATWPYFVWVYGPVHIVVDETTSEIFARGKSTRYMMNFGYSSRWTLSVKGDIKNSFVDYYGNIHYGFTFEECYYRHWRRGSGTGNVLIEQDG